MKKLINYFLQGLLFIVPVAVTVYVLYGLIHWMDNLLPFLSNLNIPGLGLIALFLVVTIAGYIGSRFVRNPFFVSM